MQECGGGQGGDVSGVTCRAGLPGGVSGGVSAGILLAVWATRGMLTSCKYKSAGKYRSPSLYSSYVSIPSSDMRMIIIMAIMMMMMLMTMLMILMMMMIVMMMMMMMMIMMM